MLCSSFWPAYVRISTKSSLFFLWSYSTFRFLRDRSTDQYKNVPLNLSCSWCIQMLLKTLENQSFLWWNDSFSSWNLLQRCSWTEWKNLFQHLITFLLLRPFAYFWFRPNLNANHRLLLSFFTLFTWFQLAALDTRLFYPAAVKYR